MASQVVVTSTGMSSASKVAVNDTVRYKVASGCRGEHYLGGLALKWQNGNTA
jgi:hypothetical protein